MTIYSEPDRYLLLVSNIGYVTYTPLLGQSFAKHEGASSTSHREATSLH